MDFRLFLESNVTYIIPKNKRELMYDFYMLQMLYKTPSAKYQRLKGQGIIVNQPDSDFRDMDRDEMIDYQLEEVAQKLIPYLKNELLEVVYFAIASELRHASEMSVISRGRHSGVNKMVLNQFRNSNFDKPGTDDIDSMGERVAAYERSLSVSNSRVGFVLAARSSFRNDVWELGFGGERWAVICDAWINLSKANSIPEMMVQIDHIYDLQHNTGSVLNKSDSYMIDNSSYWISVALDHKAHISNPIQMIKLVSPSMRKIALPAIKAKFNTTIEMHDFEKDEIIDELSKNVKKIDLTIKSLPHSIARVLFNFSKSIGNNPEELKWYIEMISKRNHYDLRFDENEIMAIIREERISYNFWNMIVEYFQNKKPMPAGNWVLMLPKLSSDEDTVFSVVRFVNSVRDHSSLVLKNYTMYTDEQISAIEHLIRNQPGAALNKIIDQMTIKS